MHVLALLFHEYKACPQWLSFSKQARPTKVSTDLQKLSRSGHVSCEVATQADLERFAVPKANKFSITELVSNFICRGQEGHPRRPQPRPLLPLWQGVPGNCAAAEPLQNKLVSHC
jgi:hypothetical protein